MFFLKRMLGSEPIRSSRDMESITRSLKLLDLVTCTSRVQQMEHRTLVLRHMHTYVVSQESELRSHDSKKPQAAGLMFKSWGRGADRIQPIVWFAKVCEGGTREPP